VNLSEIAGFLSIAEPLPVKIGNAYHVQGLYLAEISEYLLICAAIASFISICIESLYLAQ